MILFVRHGVTRYNLKGKLQGLRDIPLCAEGIKQAKQTAINLKDYKIDIIYSSPLKRAKKTAEIINKYHNAPIIIDERIIDYNVGKTFEGVKAQNITKEVMDDYWENPTNYGGQAQEDFDKQTDSFYEDIKGSKQNILIVSHSGVYRQLIRCTTGVFDRYTKVKNCVPMIIKED